MEDQAYGLRKLLAANKRGENSKFITVASGKGGVGKSNFSANLAYTLANRHRKDILLIDADIGMGNLHILLDADPRKNMRQVFNGQPIEDVIVATRGFYTLFGFSGLEHLDELEELEFHKVLEGLERISKQFDYVIIDTGAGLDAKVTSFLRASHMTYIITTPEPTAMMDAYALMKSLYMLYGYNRFRLVVNMCRSKEEGIQTFEKLRLSIRKFLDTELELAGVLPSTARVRQCVEEKVLIVERFPNDNFSRALTRIAADETGTVVSAGTNEYWSKVIGFLRNKRGGANDLR